MSSEQTESALGGLSSEAKVASNPTRVGKYRIDGVPLDDTDFANDPDYPAMTADVRELLACRTTETIARRWPVTVASLDEELPASGIVLGEVRSTADMLAWAARVDDDTVAVGSAAFLDACLRDQGRSRVPRWLAAPVDGGKRLFACGSTSASARMFCRTCEANGIPVLRMPEALFDSASSTQQYVNCWIAATLRALERHPIAVVAVDRPVRNEPGLSHRITEYLSDTIEAVIRTVPVWHLLAEGGATAEALTQHMGWERLRMVAELAPGVVTTQVVHHAELLFTMKPGSYEWPDCVLKWPLAHAAMLDQDEEP